MLCSVAVLRSVAVLCSVPVLQSWSHFVMLQEDWVTQNSKQRKPRDATLPNSFVKKWTWRFEIVVRVSSNRSRSQVIVLQRACLINRDWHITKLVIRKVQLLGLLNFRWGYVNLTSWWPERCVTKLSIRLKSQNNDTTMSGRSRRSLISDVSTIIVYYLKALTSLNSVILSASCLVNDYHPMENTSSPINFSPVLWLSSWSKGVFLTGMDAVTAMEYGLAPLTWPALQTWSNSV